MMLSLILDGTDHCRDIRSADRECAIPILPGEIAQPRKLAMHPLGRIALQKLRYLTRRQCRRSRYQGMNMVLDSAYLKSDHLMLPRDAANVGPDSVFNVLRNEPHSVFGAENNVVMKRGVSVSHDAPISIVATRRGRPRANPPGLERPGYIHTAANAAKNRVTFIPPAHRFIVAWLGLRRGSGPAGI